MINIKTHPEITKIYLVENCYGDPNKIYIGKTKICRKNKHQQTYGKDIIYTYIDEIYSLYKGDWEPLESYWIEQFRQWGFDLQNKRMKGGSGPTFYSEEAKLKMNKPILQYDLDGNFIQEWSSAGIIKKDLGYGASVSKCCCNKLRKSYGFIWKYKEKPPKIKPIYLYIEKLKEEKNILKPKINKNLQIQRK